jgi:O-antigen ligase
VQYGRWGGDTMWVGLTTQKNTIGIVSSISALFFLWSIIKGYRNNKIIFTDVVMLFMSLFLLFYGKAQSATAIVVFFIGICIFTVISMLKSKPEFTGSSIILFVSILLLLIPFYNIIITSVVEITGRDMTFTGRTRLWQELIGIASSHPILGVGYGGFWVGNLTYDLWDKFYYHPNQAHNGYIDVYIQIGLVGVFLLIMVILFSYINIFKTFVFNYEYGRFRMTLLTIILIYNITEASFLKGTNFLWFLFLLVAVNIPSRSLSCNFK